MCRHEKNGYQAHIIEVTHILYTTAVPVPSTKGTSGGYVKGYQQARVRYTAKHTWLPHNDERRNVQMEKYQSVPVQDAAVPRYTKRNKSYVRRTIHLRI